MNDSPRPELAEALTAAGSPRPSSAPLVAIGGLPEEIHRAALRLQHQKNAVMLVKYDEWKIVFILVKQSIGPEPQGSRA